MIVGAGLVTMIVLAKGITSLIPKRTKRSAKEASTGVILQNQSLSLDSAPLLA